MYYGKAFLLTLIIKLAGLNLNMSICEGEKIIRDNPRLLKLISLEELYDVVLDLREEDLIKVLRFLIINYFKMIPSDQLFYASFKDGDTQKVYDLIIKNPNFFNDLIKHFFDYLSTGKYPEVTKEEYYKILNMEAAFGEANVLLLDSFLARILDYLFEAMEKYNDFSSVSSFLAKVIFQNAQYQTNIDISYEVQMLRSYNIYLFQMLHAEIYAQIRSGLLSLDFAFEEIFLLIIKKQFAGPIPTSYLENLIKYYFLARRIGKNNKLSENIIESAHQIDPLFNEFR